MAQNLVPNGGFETINACPSGSGGIGLAQSWDSLNVSADLFNACAGSASCTGAGVPNNYTGNAAAHSGNGYAGIVAKGSAANYREYIQAPLTSPLIPGKIYKVEAWFRRASNSQYAVSSLGLTLSVGALSQSGTSNLGFPAQAESASPVSDTADWTLIRDYIIAAGGENYLTIGNFKDDGSSGIVAIPNAMSPCAFNGAYYYIDDVSVEPINELVDITGDTLICPGTNTTLYAAANTPAWWSLGDNPSVPISNDLFLTVNPLVNTTYVLNGFFYKDSVTVMVIPPPVVTLRNDTTICERDSVFLDASNSSSDYQWSTGETTSSIFAKQDETYTVQVDNGGCVVSDSFTLNVLTNPAIDLGSDTSYCQFNYDFITLDAGTGETYLWQPSGEIVQKIMVKIPGTYTVNVSYMNGCKKDTSITIYETCPPKFFVPSSFTPNDDGLNDLLCPQGNSYSAFEFSIFNRWGEIVFSTNNSSSCWDGAVKGKRAPVGVYAWRLNYSSVNLSGATENNHSTGTVTLLR